jgi:type VI secretion system secreted protein Hcp
MALVDMFLSLPGVDGESQDPDHEGEIQIDGFRLNAVSPRDAFTNQGAGAVQMSHLTIRARVDISTPKLFEKVAKNEKLGGSATLVCRKAGKEQFQYLKIVLNEVVVVRVQISGLEAGGSDVIPYCEFDLAYGRIHINAYKQTSKGPTSGPVAFMFNLMSNS